MENILTFETGLLVSGLLIILFYTFINLLIHKKTIKEQAAQIRNLNQEISEEHRDRYRRETELMTNMHSSIRDIERCLQGQLDSLRRDTTDKFDVMGNRVDENELFYEKELTTFDQLAMLLKDDLQEIRTMVKRIVPKGLDSTETLNS